MTLRLEHLGYFSLPRGVQAHDPSLPAELAKRAKAGYGGRALALSADRRHLWISGHEEGDLVALWGIPEVGGTAELRIGFRELAPRAALSAAMLDQLVGLADHEGKLWGLYQDYYDVDGRDGGRVSLWNGERLVQVGAGELKRHAGYLTTHDGSLWCGRSDGAGSADVKHGPALYRISMPLLNYGLESFSIPPRSDWTEADRYTGLVFLPGYV
ncbi:MAG TPA: hypothetical protein VFO09_05490, partial [Methyloceanibacter sp.]|nr:hypothetical protein [Methyloceanibacter sp.]